MFKVIHSAKVSVELNARLRDKVKGCRNGRLWGLGRQEGKETSPSTATTDSNVR